MITTTADSHSRGTARTSFGDGVLLQGFGQGERREVLAYFPGVGQKRLLLKYAGLTVIEKPNPVAQG